MRQSFADGGFAAPGCEFLVLDNTEAHRFDAYAGCNLFLRAARGAYVVLCHQDIRLLTDGRERLDAVIAELDRRDPHWGLFGNAGGLRSGEVAVRISDPAHGANAARGGPFPVACQTLDENFIVVRADANLALSGDLAGFHLYGTELCTVAAMLGHSAYVVDFHLRHHGRGTLDDSFVRLSAALVAKYARRMRPAVLTTTCTRLVITPSARLNRIANTRRGMRLVRLAARVAGVASRPFRRC